MNKLIIIAVLLILSLSLVAEKPFTEFRLENEKGEVFQLSDFTGKG